MNSSQLRLMHHHSSSCSTWPQMRLRISTIILSILETGKLTDGVGELGDAVSGGVAGRRVSRSSWAIVFLSAIWADGIDEEDRMFVHPGRLQGVELVCLLTTEGTGVVERCFACIVGDGRSWLQGRRPELPRQKCTYRACFGGCPVANDEMAVGKRLRVDQLPRCPVAAPERPDLRAARKLEYEQRLAANPCSISSFASCEQASPALSFHCATSPPSFLPSINENHSTRHSLLIPSFPRHSFRGLFSATNFPLTNKACILLLQFSRQRV